MNNTRHIYVLFVRLNRRSNIAMYIDYFR